MKELLQIFVECKKPLNRVQKYEKHYHWLQVKLRKFIVAEKKKEKDEKIRDFILQSPHKKNITSTRKGDERTNKKNNTILTGKKNDSRKNTNNKNESRGFDKNQNTNFENILSHNPFSTMQSSEKKVRIEKINET